MRWGIAIPGNLCYTGNCRDEWITGRFAFKYAVTKHNIPLWAKRPLSGGFTSGHSSRQRRQLGEGRFAMAIPKIGEVRHAREIGKRDRASFIWQRCPDCGLERWVLLKHGEPISKRCQPCGARFGSLKRRQAVTVICETCGSPFSIVPARKDTARYCSRKYRMTGRIVPCDDCGKDIYLAKATERICKRHFCSLGCANHFRTRLTGELSARFISKSDVDDFTPEQKNLIIGTVLGDSTILKNSNGNAHMSIAHGEKQLDYLAHKHDLLLPFAKPIKGYDRLDKRVNKVYRTYRFFLPCHPYLTELRDLFYGPSGKELPESIVENLTPASLAYWFFDDGSRTKNSTCIHIATLNFPLFQVQRACEIIKRKFDLDCHPNGRGDIYISSYSIKQFRALVEPFIIPSMRYKLP